MNIEKEIIFSWHRGWERRVETQIMERMVVWAGHGRLRVECGLEGLLIREWHAGGSLQSINGSRQITLSDWWSTQAVIMIGKVSLFNVFVIYKMFAIHKVQCKLLYFRTTKTIMITCQEIKVSSSPTSEWELMSFFVSMAFSTLYNGIHLKVSQ